MMIKHGMWVLFQVLQARDHQDLSINCYTEMVRVLPNEQNESVRERTTSGRNIKERYLTDLGSAQGNNREFPSNI